MFTFTSIAELEAMAGKLETNVLAPMLSRSELKDEQRALYVKAVEYPLDLVARKRSRVTGGY